jgi:hypothetical protein
MLPVLRRRAKQNGLDFNLTANDIVVPKLCPVLGIELEIGGDRRNSPSVDRFDNNAGYVKGNIRVISPPSPVRASPRCAAPRGPVGWLAPFICALPRRKQALILL